MEEQLKRWKDSVGIGAASEKDGNSKQDRGTGRHGGESMGTARRVALIRGQPKREGRSEQGQD